MNLKYVLSAFALLLSLNAESKNLGHRLGSDYHKHLPENSLSVLEASIYGIGGKDAIMGDDRFIYFEFDIQETLDNQLVLFHDKDFKRMIPNKGVNKAVYKQIIQNVFERTGKRYKYKKLRVELVTLKEMQSLYLNANILYKVPSLEEVLNFAIVHKVKKPMVLEIKKLHSNTGRDKALNLMQNFKLSYGDNSEISFTRYYDYPLELTITFLAFPKAVEYSFPNESLKRSYCKRIQEMGFGGIYRARKHKFDFCSLY